VDKIIKKLRGFKIKNISRAKKTQSWINQIKAYQKKAPDLYNEDIKRSDSEFNINHYFDILENIKLEEAWLADDVDNYLAHVKPGSLSKSEGRKLKSLRSL
jgi:hypothetical protein